MDLDAKLIDRDTAIDKYHGKSIIKNTSRILNENNDTYLKSNSSRITEFDEIVGLIYPDILNRKGEITMNNEVLFNYGKELLENIAIDKIKCNGLNTSQTIYTLPCTYEIEEPQNNVVKTENTFTFKGKLYDYDKIYKINSTKSSKLEEVCNQKLEIPTILPENIKELNSTATNGRHYFNLFHDCDNYYYHNNNFTYIAYENDEELIKQNNSESANNSYTLVKKVCDPIYVKINQKGKFDVTHIGFLGSKVPIMSFYNKKKSKESKETQKQLRYCRKLTKKVSHIYDKNVGFAYVKKVEIWFRGIKTKKWNYLKTVTLNYNGLNSYFDEDVISVFNNINSTEGIVTNELKIVPLEYVNKPMIRIAVYGNVVKDLKYKTTNGDNMISVEYGFYTPNDKKYMLKDSEYRGKNWYSYFDDHAKTKRKRELNNIMKNEINDDL